MVVVCIGFTALLAFGIKELSRDKAVFSEFGIIIASIVEAMDRGGTQELT